MLNSHPRPDSRSPFLHHGLAHAAAVTEHRDRAQGMDPPSSSGRPTTPRRQLQGPRPPRLNVSMESHAIKKPSASGLPPAPAPAPGQGQGRRDHQHPQPGRAPVIIYDASPKVIHAKPSEFMALVQRLTGPGGSGTPPPPADAQAQYQRHAADDDDILGQAFLPPELLLSPSAAMSPAARLATIERSVRPMPAPAPLRPAPSAPPAQAPRPTAGPGSRRRPTTPTRSSPAPATCSPRPPCHRRPRARSSSAACRIFSSPPPSAGAASVQDRCSDGRNFCDIFFTPFPLSHPFLTLFWRVEASWWARHWRYLISAAGRA